MTFFGIGVVNTNASNQYNHTVIHVNKHGKQYVLINTKLVMTILSVVTNIKHLCSPSYTFGLFWNQNGPSTY